MLQSDTSRQKGLLMYDFGVPLPPQKYKGIQWSKMEIGESVFIEAAKGRGCLQVLRNMNSRYKANGSARKFEWRDVEGGLRIWRVA